VPVHAATEYTYTNLDVVLDGVTVTRTQALGIDGNNIVGYYQDNNNDYHGFLASAVVVLLPTSAWGYWRGSVATVSFDAESEGTEVTSISSGSIVVPCAAGAVV